MAKQVKEKAPSLEERRVKAGRRAAESPKSKQIQIRSLPLFQDDMRTFLPALRAALSKTNPNRTLLVDIYDRAKLEAHLTSVLNQRLTAIAQQEWMFVDAQGNELPEITAKMKAPWFREFLEVAAKAKIDGTQLVQIASDVNPLGEDGLPTELEVMDQRYFRPELDVWTQTTAGIDGESYVEPPYADFMIRIGGKHELGLMLQACQIAILKKHGLSGWSQYIGLISTLIRIGKTDITNPDQRTMMEEALAQMSELEYMVTDREDEVEILDQAKGSGASSPHLQANTYYDGLISKLFVGQTLTTDTASNGNRALGEVQERVSNTITFAECARISEVVNFELIPRLVKLGVTWLQGATFKYDTSEKLTIPQRVEIIKTLLPYGKVDPDYITNLTGIPFEYSEPEVSVEPGKL